MSTRYQKDRDADPEHVGAILSGLVPPHVRAAAEAAGPPEPPRPTRPEGPPPPDLPLPRGRLSEEEYEQRCQEIARAGGGPQTPEEHLQHDRENRRRNPSRYIDSEKATGPNSPADFWAGVLNPRRRRST